MTWLSVPVAVGAGRVCWAMVMAGGHRYAVAADRVDATASFNPKPWHTTTMNVLAQQPYQSRLDRYALFVSYWQMIRIELTWTPFGPIYQIVHQYSAA